MSNDKIPEVNVVILQRNLSRMIFDKKIDRKENEKILRIESVQQTLRAYCPNIYTVPGTMGDNGFIFIQIGVC